MKRIIGTTTLAIFVGAAAVYGAAQGGSTGQPAVPRRAEPMRETKAREQQPGVSAQATPNCSGRLGARCAKKGGAKKLRTIF